jgi:sn-glycerol 3-phosphate transport system permease protein
MVDSMGKIKVPVGFENYTRVLSDAKFLVSIKNTMLYAVMAAPLSIITALFLALVAQKRRKISSVYETMFALTMAMSMSVSAMIFRLAYNPTIGALNYILHTRVNWLNDSRFAMPAISLISVWMNIGYNFIFLLAGVRGISNEILESTELDGASVFRKTMSIIVPMISPTLFFLICTSLAKSITMSGLVLIFTNTGAIATTANIETMISYMYKQAVNNLNYNDAYAAAMIAFVITFVLILLSFRFEKKGVYYK